MTSKADTVQFNVNGTREMVYEGVRALEALDELRQSMTFGEDTDVAEIRIYENMPIEAVLCDDDGATTWVWNRENWVELT